MDSRFQQGNGWRQVWGRLQLFHILFFTTVQKSKKTGAKDKRDRGAGTGPGRTYTSRKPIINIHFIISFSPLPVLTAANFGAKIVATTAAIMAKKIVFRENKYHSNNLLVINKKAKPIKLRSKARCFGFTISNDFYMFLKS